MRSESQFVGFESKLLNDLAQVAVIEHAISRQIVGDGDEVSFRSRLFARARDAGLGVGNNSVLTVYDAGFH